MTAPGPSTQNMMLQVRLIKAKDLAPKDKSGKSDPYIKWTLDGKKKAKSKIVKQNLNPEWNETYYWEGCTERTVVRGEMWDHDLVGKDFMGFIQIDTADMMVAVMESVERWMPLQKRTPSDKVTGEVLINIQFREKPNANFDMDAAKALAADVKSQGGPAGVTAPVAPSAPNDGSAPVSSTAPPLPPVPQPVSAIPPGPWDQPPPTLPVPPNNPPPMMGGGPPPPPPPKPHVPHTAPPAPHQPDTAPPPLPLQHTLPMKRNDAPPCGPPPPFAGQGGPPPLPPMPTSTGPSEPPPSLPSQPPALPPPTNRALPLPSQRPLPAPPAQHAPPHSEPPTTAPLMPPPSAAAPMPPVSMTPPADTPPIPRAKQAPPVPPHPHHLPPTPSEPTVTAIFEYNAANDTELSLVVGNSYTIEKEEDGWYQGKDVVSGKFGWFPGNYVQK